MTTLQPPFPRTTVFALDAALAASLGLTLLLLAEPLAQAAGAGLSSTALRWVGVGLLPWAAHNALTARSPRGHAWVQLVGDGLWIAASLALCVAHWPALTALGKGLYVGQGLVVVPIFAAKLRVVRA